MLSIRHRPSRHLSLTLSMVALALALVSSAVISMAAPAEVLGATSTKAALCGVNLRRAASLSGTVRATIRSGTRVSVVATVSGSSWRAVCAGRTVSGRSWYRISAINGRSVRSLYGVSYLYGATGLFKAVSTPAPAPTPAPTPSPTPTPAPDPTPPGLVEGIDISHWQGTIDWGQVAAAGKRFAFMKASEGTTYSDPTYPTNRAGATGAGMYIGAYHFAQPDATPGDAVAEADHFVDTAQPGSGELVPVLDLEASNGLSVPSLQAWVAAYLGRIYERIGVRGAIYVSPAFWAKYMGDTTWFADNGYDVLWIAHWTTADAPWVAAGNWGGNGWTFWQYTSSGSVPGISGRVDLDRYAHTDFTDVLIP